MLRSGTPSSDVVFDGDDLATTFHLGAAYRGRIVAISTWLERPPESGEPDRSPLLCYQLRGMASHPAERGTGSAAAVLAAGIDRCRALGARIVWARARTTAVGFYEHHGFEITSGEYTDPTTGLPHRDIAIHLH